jgi:hypothetical protein
MRIAEGTRAFWTLLFHFIGAAARTPPGILPKSRAEWHGLRT